MKGYKALDQDMRAVNGNGMQYKMGKWYFASGEIIPCERGFHFCGSIEILNRYYPIKDSRIFIVDTDGKIVQCDNKYVAEGIKLVRELTKEEIEDYFKEKQDELIKSEDLFAKKALIEQGYGLDKLINDKYSYIRKAVAKQGYGLDVLINDSEWEVRRTVAEQGYGLDKLVEDNNFAVRKAVAEQGYGLDILINDEEWYVRAAVAQQGYGLNELIKDEDCTVREMAQKMLAQKK